MLELNEVGAVVFSVLMAMLATIGGLVLINALRFFWTTRRDR